MPVEIRPAKPDEMEEYKRVASSALVMKASNFDGMRPEWTLCAFEDENLATSFGAWPLTMLFNGNSIPVSGITAVGSLPLYRRRGYLRKVMTTHFQNLYEEGERSIAILYASLTAIYQRYGYAIVSTRNSYDIDPRYIKFSFDRDISGRFREVIGDDIQVLVDLYRDFRKDRNGYLHRGGPMWNAGVLSPVPANQVLAKVVYVKDGEPQGYLVYMDQPGQGQLPSHRLGIRDLIWLNDEAYRAIWGYLANMDLVSNITWGQVPSDDPLPHMLLDPRQLHMTSADGILGRLVNVEKAMTGRRYLEESTLIFRVIDDVCPWNDGNWKLETSTEGSTMTRVNSNPQLIIPVSTLALLAFGQISTTEAARMGRLEVMDSAALTLWDTTLRTMYKPACVDMF